MTKAFSSIMRYPAGINYAVKAPKRVSITIPYDVYLRLTHRSDAEGRSLSNLSALLLESEIEKYANKE
jgi:macrodomain Ter protein organizer (MatP/YcbG family)